MYGNTPFKLHIHNMERDLLEYENKSKHCGQLGSPV